MPSLTELANPTRFLAFSARVLPWLSATTVSLFALGLYLGLFVAPADYVMKPVETGVVGEPEDAVALRAAAGDPAPLDDVCPYRLRAPLAPAVAARLEGATLDVDRLVALIRRRTREADVFVVEGAGGLLVPVVGIITAWLVRGEHPSWGELLVLHVHDRSHAVVDDARLLGRSRRSGRKRAGPRDRVPG